jgi:hypothetical protein
MIPIFLRRSRDGYISTGEELLAYAIFRVEHS